MSRLSRYLVVRFAAGGLALYLIATFLVWLIQMLRLFDLVTVKGQSLFTLLGQSFLTTPPLSRQIIYICMGIGLIRAFSALNASRELHTIHISHRLKSIWGALAIFSLSGALFALFIANWAEPVARRTASLWTAQIAVDLLSQSLTPGRFTDISEGVVLRIGGRDGNGVIQDFFADDRRDPNMRRTYMAERAEIVIGPQGYQISLRNGRLQAAPASGKYSEIEFARYDLAIESLTDPVRVSDPLAQRDTWTMIMQAQNGNGFSAAVIHQIHFRMAEGVRVISLCLLVCALGAFPNSRRRRQFFPPELGILVIALGERSISNFAAKSFPLGHYIGPAMVMLMAILLLAYYLVPRKGISFHSLPAQRVEQ